TAGSFTTSTVPRGTINSPNVYHETQIAMPVFLHSVLNSGGTTTIVSNRGYRATLKGFVCIYSSADPVAGDIINIGGANYIVIGGSIANSTRFIYAVHPTAVF